jgi:hypothetical protein
MSNASSARLPPKPISFSAVKWGELCCSCSCWPSMSVAIKHSHAHAYLRKQSRDLAVAPPHDERRGKDQTATHRCGVEHWLGVVCQQQDCGAVADVHAGAAGRRRQNLASKYQERLLGVEAQLIASTLQQLRHTAVGADVLCTSCARVKTPQPPPREQGHLAIPKPMPRALSTLLSLRLLCSTGSWPLVFRSLPVAPVELQH